MSRTTTTSLQVALKRRVRAFYTQLNARAFEKCYRFLDPRIFAEAGSVTLIQYETLMAEFMAHVREVRVKEVVITGWHIGQPSKLYAGRDFALGKTAWEDANGTVRHFAERWVVENGLWYTRATGLILPASVPLTPQTIRPAIPLSRLEPVSGKIQSLTPKRKATKPSASKKPTRL